MSDQLVFIEKKKQNKLKHMHFLLFISSKKYQRPIFIQINKKTFY